MDCAVPALARYVHFSIGRQVRKRELNNIKGMLDYWKCQGEKARKGKGGSVKEVGKRIQF